MAENHDFVAEIIESSAKALSEWTVSLQEERSPGLRDLLGDASMLDFRADTQVRIRHLANAVAFDEPGVLASHVGWSKLCLAARDVPLDILEGNLACLREVLLERLPGSAAPLVERQMESAARALREGPTETPSHVEGEGADASLARRYLLALLEGDRGAAHRSLEEAVAWGRSVPDLFESVIQPVQAELGRMWQIDEISVADEHLASASSEWVVGRLALQAPKAPSRDRAMIASSVGGDTHSFGVRMVADAFEMDGWRTYFLGASTPLVDLVGAVIERRADLLALSANLGCHLREMKRVIDAIRAQPEAEGVVVMVGGGGVDSAGDALWRKLGADGGARSARQAVAEGNRLLDAREKG